MTRSSPVKRWFDRLRSSGVPGIPAKIPRPDKPICVLVHVFYPDLWPDLRRYIRNFGDIPVDLRVNVVRAVATDDFIASIRAGFPSVSIKVSPNRGRDLGGFFALLADVDFAQHDIFCLMHTKKSPHGFARTNGRRWRRALLDAIAKDRNRTAANIQLMLDDPNTGLIGARKYRSTHLAANAVMLNGFLDRLGIEGENRRCEFVAGTMMLVRGSVLRMIFEAFRTIEFEDGDGKPLKFHLDGQHAHVFERLIGNVTRHLGLRMVWR